MTASIHGHLESICCEYHYSVCYETGLLILLYRYSRPRRLSPDMEQVFGMQRSKLSAIVHTFSTALYHVSLPYLSNLSIWHQQMPYFAELIKRKTGYVIDSLWGFVDGMICKTAVLSTINKPFIPGSKSVMESNSNLCLSLMVI